MMKNFFGLPLDKLLSDTNSEAIAKAIFPFIIMLIAGIFFIILYSIQFFFQSIPLGFSILGIVGTTAGAAILSGSFLGFLFGIPRIDRKQDESESDTSKISNDTQLSKSSISVIPNTNLEEISDWLTKILVGVGLTQINPIFNSINSFAKSLSPALTNPQIPDLKLVSEAFTLLILIYFCICGFFLAFLWARLYLPESFRNADSVKKIDEKVQQIEEDIEQKQKDMDAQILVNRQLNIRFPPEEAERLFKRIKAASIDAMRIIFVQAQAVRSDNWKDDKVKMERTIPVFKALIDGYKEKSKDPYHRHYAELGFALKDKREPDWEKAKESLEKAIELRGDFSKHGNWTTYYEFNHALCLIHLDSNFKNNTPSNEKTREVIIKDLKMAIEGGCLTKEKLKREEFQRWIEVNNVNWSDLGLTDD